MDKRTLNPFKPVGQTELLAVLDELQQLDRAGHIPRLAQHEVHPNVPKGSRERYLYFFLACTLNFQRSSPALWQSALKTWLDPETQFVFFPELIIQRGVDDVRIALLKHRLALQPNKHVKIWTAITQTLHDSFADDPRTLIELANNTVYRFLQIVRVEQKAEFPYLSGPKLSNYVIAILTWFTDAAFVDLHNLSIIPDTHIIQATVKLGLLPSNPTTEAVIRAWQPVLPLLAIPPHEMHSLLWRWSRNGFSPAVTAYNA